jgi:Protein of unknown function (DUF3500)
MHAKPTTTAPGTYRGYAPRPTIPDIRLFHGFMSTIPVIDRPDFAALATRFEEPYVGVTTSGAARHGLYAADADTNVSEADRETSTEARLIVDAANDFLATLTSSDARLCAQHSFDSVHRRRWTNAFVTWMPPGVLLDDLTAPQREAALKVVERSMSSAGFDEARKMMILNEALGDIIGMYRDTLKEYVYFFTIFGEPSETEPWGWQLMGHHLVLNCAVVGDQVVLSPVFMGAETIEMDEGRFAGLRAFDEEHDRGLEMIRALSPGQQETAILYRSMLSKDLPPELGGRVEGRHRGGAGRDNLVLAYEGIDGGSLTTDQRELLLRLIDTYLSRSAPATAKAQLARAERHLDETHFAWIGDPSRDGSPFYYRVHSPVVLLEFDHHPGIFLDFEDPQPFHAHTIVRFPNGGDYGMDLLRDRAATPALS